METKTLDLSQLCQLLHYEYDNGETEINLDYIERSHDYWYPDEEQSIEITKEKAIEIINFLTRALEM